MEKVHNYLKEEVSGYSLAIFRILFGSILFGQSIYWVLTGFIEMITQGKKKLFLIDSYALIYRAYFAFIKNPRINSKGFDTEFD